MAVQQKQPTRRKLVEEARAAAHDGLWDEAIRLNELLIEKNEKDAEAYNRLGRAYLALGKLGMARDSYQKSLKADPANLIARRNLQRLDELKNRPEKDLQIFSGTMPRANVFIEEVGKTWVDELVNAAHVDLLAEVFPGEELDLEVSNGRLFVNRRKTGQRLGEIEARTAERVIALIGDGNRYEIFALGISGSSLRFILREVYRNPANVHRISFPRQITSRAYLRERDLLRARDEADFFLHDEDEEDEEETVSGEPDEEDGFETEPDVSALDDTIVLPEDDSEMQM
ncbi:MAG: tetratricopeptide repeat protein [Chloroflexota bacterium]